MVPFGGEHMDISVIQQIFKNNTSHFSASADEKYPQQTVRPLVFHAWQPFFRPPRPALRLKYLIGNQSGNGNGSFGNLRFRLDFFSARQCSLERRIQLIPRFSFLTGK